VSALHGTEVRVMTAIPINAVTEPYIRLRAIKASGEEAAGRFRCRYRPALRHH
jgi:hypothetical protein